MFSYETKSKISYVIQGKQQLYVSIYDYMKDNYKLHKNTPPVENDDGKEIIVANHKFSQLPEEFQDRIRNYALTIWKFTDLTSEELEELFFRVNSGKALTNIELARTKMKSLSTFQSN